MYQIRSNPTHRHGTSPKRSTTSLMETFLHNVLRDTPVYRTCGAQAVVACWGQKLKASYDTRWTRGFVEKNILNETKANVLFYQIASAIKTRNIPISTEGSRSWNQLPRWSLYVINPMSFGQSYIIHGHKPPYKYWNKLLQGVFSSAPSLRNYVPSYEKAKQVLEYISHLACIIFLILGPWNLK